MINVLIHGAGIAGQVLCRELALKGIPSRLTDRASFPRDKVCGGVLQPDSWEYLNSIFTIKAQHREISAMRHYWKGKLLSRIGLKKPLIYCSRFSLDSELNAQQPEMPSDGVDQHERLHVFAAGVNHQKSKGQWLGFQGLADPADELEMHFGDHVYLGIAPAWGENSHAALVIKKDFFETTEKMEGYIKKEFGVRLRGPLKGTPGIDYAGDNIENAAVGDAKLTTHPCLGLGMKHAIGSARLMACLIAEGRAADYPREHRHIFSKYRFVSRLVESLYGVFGGPAIIRAFFSQPILIRAVYNWLHENHLLEMVIKKHSIENF